MFRWGVGSVQVACGYCSGGVWVVFRWRVGSVQVVHG